MTDPTATDLQHAALEQPLGWRPLLHAALALLVVLVATLLVTPPPARTGDPAAITRLQLDLAEQRPDTLLLGNSILDEAVDADEFARLTGQRTHKLALPGSASAVWFVLMKNVVVTAPHRPRRVVIFFRDYFLTDPAFRTTGAEKRHQLDPYTTDDEPLLDSLAYEQQMHVLELQVLRHWSLYRSREGLASGLQSHLASAVSPDAGEAFSRVFAEQQLDQQLVTQQQLAVEADTDDHALPFADQLPRSFLPAIIQLAHDAGIELTFVRMRRRNVAAGHADSPRKLAYIADLRAYLESQSCALIDFTDDERITLAHFAGGDHLDRTTGRPLFTRLLAERLANDRQ
ncbi:MAG: hypothetical protein AB7K09_14170 [Planctomycetota bacterium]